VGVADGLRDLSQHGQLLGKRYARLVGEPEVEPLQPLVVAVDEPDAELVVDEVPGSQQPVVGQAGHDAELMIGDAAYAVALFAGGSRGRDEEADAVSVRGGDPVEGGPVLPALALAERLLVDDPGADLPLAALHHSDLGQQRGDDLVAVGPDDVLRRGRLEQPVRDAGQAGARLVPVDAVQVDLRRGRQQAPQTGVVEEHGLLDERHDVPRVGHLLVVLPRPPQQLVLQLARQALCLAGASLSGESSARCPSRSQRWSSPRRVPL
jgi:hypothetical protein